MRKKYLMFLFPVAGLVLVLVCLGGCAKQPKVNYKALYEQNQDTLAKARLAAEQQKTRIFYLEDRLARLQETKEFYEKLFGDALKKQRAVNLMGK